MLYCLDLAILGEELVYLDTIVINKASFKILKNFLICYTAQR